MQPSWLIPHHWQPPPSLATLAVHNFDVDSRNWVYAPLIHWLHGFPTKRWVLHTYHVAHVPCVKNWTTPELLRTTFPHYSGLHSHTTLVYIPALLQSVFLLRSILLCHSSPPLDRTGLHSACLSTGLAPDLTWEVAVIHLSLMYLFLVIYTY